MMSSKERQQQQQQQLLVARGESLPLLHLDEETSSSRGKFVSKKTSFFSFVGGKGKGKDDASGGGSKKAALLFVSGFSLVAACSLLILQAYRDGARSVRLLGATTYYENPVYVDNNTDPMSERDVNDIKTSKMTLTLTRGARRTRNFRGRSKIRKRGEMKSARKLYLRRIRTTSSSREARRWTTPGAARTRWRRTSC